MLSRALIDSLFDADLPTVEQLAAQYPPRALAPGAKVTRFAPSPTGFVHIGGVYVATIARDVAHHTGGSYFVRIEDTDLARVVESSGEQFVRAFSYFDIASDESDADPWGPYEQSKRARIYESHVRQLLYDDRAFICFATKEELAASTLEQQAEKIPPGYYGRWATWRDATEDQVVAALEAGKPYVVRFRAPEGPRGRAAYDDLIRGRIEQDDNINCVVILKTSDQPPRLPTYHLAHAVDDHLMGVTTVIRGDEWIPSVPVHHQLFDALGFPHVEYAHIAPLMKTEGGSKRKLSKRKDPEASVDFFIEAGYPADAVKYYLRGLANSRIAELPIAEALVAPIHLAECGVAGPLVDMAKLENISRDVIGDLTTAEVLDAVRTWAAAHDPELLAVLDSDPDLARRAIGVERDVPEPRKDLGRWSTFREIYAFFFPALFAPVTDPADERFAGLDPETVRSVATAFADAYTSGTDRDVWFDQVRTVARDHGYAPGPAEWKADQAAYKGQLRPIANVIRVALTGSSKSPDLFEVSNALGDDEVLRRLRAVGG